MAHDLKDLVVFPMMQFKRPQAAGEFGNTYTERCLQATRCVLFFLFSFPARLLDDLYEKNVLHFGLQYETSTRYFHFFFFLVPALR